MTKKLDNPKPQKLVKKKKQKNQRTKGKDRMGEEREVLKRRRQKEKRQAKNDEDRREDEGDEDEKEDEEKVEERDDEGEDSEGFSFEMVSVECDGYEAETDYQELGKVEKQRTLTRTFIRKTTLRPLSSSSNPTVIFRSRRTNAEISNNNRNLPTTGTSTRSSTSGGRFDLGGSSNCSSVSDCKISSSSSSNSFINRGRLSGSSNSSTISSCSNNNLNPNTGSDECCGGGNRNSASTTYCVGEADHLRHRHHPPPPRLELELFSPFKIDLTPTSLSTSFTTTTMTMNNSSSDSSSSSSANHHLFPTQFNDNHHPQHSLDPSSAEMSSSTNIHYQLSEASHSAPDLYSPSIPSTDSNQTISNLNTAPQVLSATSSSLSSSAHDLRLEKKFQALLEIISTESNYLNDLRFLNDFYWFKLDSFDHLDEYSRSRVKRNFDQLIQLTERFNKRLGLAIGSTSRLSSSIIAILNLSQPKSSAPLSPSASTSNPSSGPRLSSNQDVSPNSGARDEDEVDRLIEGVAKAFISESPIFAVYEEFCARHSEAADLVRSFESTPEWQSLLHQPIQLPIAITSSIAHSASATTPTSSVPSNNLNHANLSMEPASAVGNSTTRSPSPQISNTPNLQQSKLTLQDLIIKPIQRIMRYPMLLNSLLKYMNSSLSNPVESRAKERVLQALSAMREVAEAVDHAKSVREIELKTELIASRIELHSSYRSAFVCLLGQIRLVGSLHLLYHGPSLDLGSSNSESLKIKYLGVFLYQTHLVIVKVKRATVYEPRHWFPIRYFDLIDLPDHSGVMSYSFSLKYRQHNFEFGARSEAEKNVWFKELSQVKEDVERYRQLQSLSDLPLSDDSIVSSVNLNSYEMNNEGITTRAASPMTAVDDDQPPSPLPHQAPVSSTPQQQSGLTVLQGHHNPEEFPSTPSAPIHPPRVSQRLSRNVNTLLGRTPEVAQAAIDLKLTEVFSEVLHCARLQDYKEPCSNGSVNGSSSRARTLSGTAGSLNKRQNPLSMVGRSGDRNLKRMSCMEPTTSRTLEVAPPLPSRAHSISPESFHGKEDAGRLRSRSHTMAQPSSNRNPEVTEVPREGATSTKVGPGRNFSRRTKSAVICRMGEEDALRPEGRNGEHDDDDSGDDAIESLERANDDGEECKSGLERIGRVIDYEEDTNETKKPESLRPKSSLSSIQANPSWLPGFRLVRRFSRAGSFQQTGQKLRSLEAEPLDDHPQTSWFDSGTRRSRVTNQSLDITAGVHSWISKDNPDEDSKSKVGDLTEPAEGSGALTMKSESLRWKKGFKLSPNTSSFANISKLRSSKPSRAAASVMPPIQAASGEASMEEKENTIKTEPEVEEECGRSSEGLRMEKSLERERRKEDKWPNNLTTSTTTTVLSPSQTPPRIMTSNNIGSSTSNISPKLIRCPREKAAQGGSYEFGVSKNKTNGATGGGKISTGFGSVIKSMMRFSKTFSEPGISPPNSSSPSPAPSPNRHQHHQHHNLPRNLESGLGTIKS